MNITLNLRDTAIGAGLMLIIVISAATGYKVTSIKAETHRQKVIASIDFSGCEKKSSRAIWTKELRGKYAGEVYLRCLK